MRVGLGRIQFLFVSPRTFVIRRSRHKCLQETASAHFPPKVVHGEAERAVALQAQERPVRAAPRHIAAWDRGAPVFLVHPLASGKVASWK